MSDVETGTYFGYHCPRCGSKSNIAAVIGSGTYSCGNCGIPMVPDPEGATTATSITCPNCHSIFGVISGFSGHCPSCGARIA